MPYPFVEARNYTRGREGSIEVLVIHAMEAAEKPDTAKAVARWFAGPDAPRASAHYCVDADSIVQCVRDDDVAWHAPGANHNGLGFEHAGFSAQTAVDWDDAYSRAMLSRSARLVAGKCRQYGIPATWLLPTDLLAGRRGITSHWNVSRAFRRSDHTDPGSAFPAERYVLLVRRLLAAATRERASTPGVYLADEPAMRPGSGSSQIRRLAPRGVPAGVQTLEAATQVQRIAEPAPTGTLRPSLRLVTSGDSTLDTEPVRRRELAADPLRQFQAWFGAAGEFGIAFPETVTLATATRDGRPSARQVLLKSFGKEGFVFFSNYESRKGRELAANPHAALLFHWGPLGRQVRIEGVVTRVPRSESEEYWSSRPLGSRLSAAASPQGKVVASRDELEARVARLEAAGDPQLPGHWGGYRLEPETYEFWEHRDDRLHDRFRYRRDARGWAIERLAP